MIKEIYSTDPKVEIIKISYSEIDKIDFVTCAQPRETIENFYNRQTIKPDLVINGGFFGMNTDGLPVFNFIDDNKQMAKNTSYTWGVGVSLDRKKLLYGSYKRIN